MRNWVPRGFWHTAGAPVPDARAQQHHACAQIVPALPGQGMLTARCLKRSILLCRHGYSSQRHWQGCSEILVLEADGADGLQCCKSLPLGRDLFLRAKLWVNKASESVWSSLTTLTLPSQPQEKPSHTQPWPPEPFICVCTLPGPRK